MIQGIMDELINLTFKKENWSNVMLMRLYHFQFSNGYQPTVGVDYGFKIQNVQGIDCRHTFISNI